MQNNAQSTEIFDDDDEEANKLKADDDKGDYKPVN